MKCFEYKTPAGETGSVTANTAQVARYLVAEAYTIPEEHAWAITLTREKLRPTMAHFYVSRR